MYEVWKYVIQPESEIEMPVDSQVLSVGTQGDDICIWAKVDPLAPKTHRNFVVFGTGHQIPDYLKLSFIGTAFLHCGQLVFHVFEVL